MINYQPRIQRVVLIVLVALGAAVATSAQRPALAQNVSAPALSGTQRADFRGETVTPGTRHIADWAVHSGDHQRLPFIVLDKVHATAAAFDASGQLIAITPVLIGMGIGDAFAPGVINMDMYQTLPSQRITPAGRFFAEEDRNLKGQRVLWVDYDAGIAIHKLSSKKTKQRRHDRMASASAVDRRITFGCINVPPAFYEQVVSPGFRPKGGIVYVLPDVTPLKSVFRSYEVAPTYAQQSGEQARPTDVRKF